MSVKKISRTFILFFMGFICVSYAQYNRFVGQYVSLNAGESIAEKIKHNNVQESGFLSPGGNLFVGDQINLYFAPEIGVAYFHLGHAENGLTLYDIGGRVTMPIENNLGLFAKLGIGEASIKTCFQTCRTTNTTVPTVGLGLGVGILPSWMGTLEFNGAYILDNNLNAEGLIGGLTLGITHYFQAL